MTAFFIGNHQVSHLEASPPAKLRSKHISIL